MDQRKRRVLRAIVDDYVHTAEPVGSRTVARKYNLGVSPATIRNEMADLEEQGYLEQPHASAGRIPSDKGYRYYVDTMVAETAEQDVDREAVRGVLAFKARRIEGVVRQAAHVLAEATDFLALVRQPAGADERLVALQVVPLRETETVLVLITDDGRVRDKVVRFSRPPAPHDLDRISRALSERLRGTLLRDLAEGLGRSIAAELGSYREVVDEVKAMLGEPDAGGDRLLLDGTTNLLKQPEFHEVASAKRVLAALERAQLLEEMLDVPQPGLPGLEVAIGREMQIEEMTECSLITAVYAGPGRVCGRIGVLGPRRMDYARVMRLVEGVAGAVTRALGDGADVGPAPAPGDPVPGAGSRAGPGAAAGVAGRPGRRGRGRRPGPPAPERGSRGFGADDGEAGAQPGRGGRGGGRAGR